MVAIIIISSVTLLNLASPEKLSKLESGLVAVKLFAILGFILLALMLVAGLYPGRSPVGIGVLTGEPLLPRGISGIAGSMLIVMFTYAGFEVIGLAAPDSTNPHVTIPKAISMTILGLIALYTLAVTMLLLLLPTGFLDAEISPFVLGLSYRGLDWGAGLINLIPIVAILSTMLAALYGLGRMIRSLAEEGYAPRWLNEPAARFHYGVFWCQGWLC